MHVLLHFIDGGDGSAQGGIWSEIERDGDRWKLSLMRDREWLRRRLEVREGAERNRAAGG